jgi:para-aminobenzoate synthetase component 1
MSPELFLEFDAATRRVTTRPMKGTRPGNADPAELEASPKDRAELNMIIDLMRNDLGRVCRFGSVRVESVRTIEGHGQSSPPHLLTCSPAHEPPSRNRSPALWQATGTVTGELHEGLDACDLLGAAFPPGSVTGAPKIRAMQIIDELEPVARGPYCGCIGWIGDDGSAAFSVAIRTALITGTAGDRSPDWIEDGVLDYSVGAGIVADSDPESEWRETLDKAGVLEVGAERR